MNHTPVSQRGVTSTRAEITVKVKVALAKRNEWGGRGQQRALFPSDRFGEESPSTAGLFFCSGIH